ncbi:MAG: hypothetical protein K9G59_02855 [Caulobacter sp.]|nr:hypothetical protein [Caulobacter sp.]
MAWIIGLVSGAVLIGGSPSKPLLLRRRTNLAGYSVAMTVLAAVAAFCWFEGGSEAGWFGN